MTPACIYLNAAGTSWPKPGPVLEAVDVALRADPWVASEDLDRHHAELAERFSVPKSSLLLTPGCTAALHLAVADLPWRPGDAAVIGPFEHLALERPIRALAARGVEVVVAPPGPGAEPVDLHFVQARLRAGGVRLLAFSHAANVTGASMPIDALRRLAQVYGATMLVDAAQTVGWLFPNLAALGDLVAFGSHKGLQGPWGLGALYRGPNVAFETPRADGPLDGPSWCDAGSLDRAALAGVVAGARWLSDRPGRLRGARSAIQELQDGLQNKPGLRILGPQGVDERMPTLAFTLSEVAPNAAAARLRARGIVVSAGVQCAPLAHRHLGTADGGAIRISVGPEQNVKALSTVIDAIRSLT